MESRRDSLPMAKPVRVVVIGSGLVGSTYAYALLLQDVADEICLIDKNQDIAMGQAMDLNHAMPMVNRTEIWAGDMDDVRDADVVLIAAGVSQKPGETRMDLLKRNSRVVGDIAQEVGDIARKTIILMATNPVDVMAYVAMVRSNLPPSRVMGLGTALDTARLRYLTGKELGIDPKSVHAFVMGEHGDSEFVAWSRATIAGISIEDWPDLRHDAQDRIESEVRDAAYQVISRKGATYYAPAVTLSRVTEAIVKDLRTVFSVCVYLEGEYGIYGVYMGAPAVVGKEGILRTIEIPLSGQELVRLQSSGRVIRRAISDLEMEVPHYVPEMIGVAAFEASEELSRLEDNRRNRRRVRRPTKRPRPLQGRLDDSALPAGDRGA